MSGKWWMRLAGWWYAGSLNARSTLSTGPSSLSAGCSSVRDVREATKEPIAVRAVPVTSPVHPSSNDASGGDVSFSIDRRSGSVGAGDAGDAGGMERSSMGAAASTAAATAHATSDPCVHDWWFRP